jgi:hypothetical protein
VAGPFRHSRASSRAPHHLSRVCRRVPWIAALAMVATVASASSAPAIVVRNRGGLAPKRLHNPLRLVQSSQSGDASLAKLEVDVSPDGALEGRGRTIH